MTDRYHSFRYHALLVALSLVGGALSSWLFHGQPVLAQKAVLKTIAAEEFRLVDGEGKERASLGMGGGAEPGLVLFDNSGKPRASLSLFGAVVPILRFYDHDGQTRLLLSLAGDGTVAIQLSDRAGRRQITLKLEEGDNGSQQLAIAGQDGRSAVLALLSNGSLSLAFSDRNSKTRAKLMTMSDGSPSLNLFDRDGTVRTMLGVYADGSPNLVHYDKRQARIVFGLNAGGRAIQTFNDRAGRSRAVFGLSDEDNPELELFDKDEKAIWKAP